MRGRRALALAAVLGALALPSAVRADGEAGLVIQQGADVQAFCIAFQGDSISGEALLRAAGRSFDQFGGGARVLCSLDGVGCSDSSSFESCFCQCKAGSGSCTYWAFFTQRYAASWAYSTVGFNLARARDGDLHGWKWGEGGAQSAPAPSPITFEDVCGHPPRGGVSVATPTATATSTAVSGSPGSGTAPAATAPPPGDASVSPGASTSTADPVDTPASTVGPSTVAPSASETASPTFAPSVTITIGRSSPSPAASDAEQPEVGDGDRPSVAGLLAFAAVAGTLLAAVAGALVWRARRGR